ncbi:hypothetical protein [Niabella hibiscisoli]|uniref:hypothetical protein n=1 Tax=Niabella hibiscisoli TaxID=1825928 RepID=UPI001F0E9AA5|nr:hypothetical protein [Niabella hibiscisoli]MCH5714965.1 hypothetical protein [Niabella hibiscisoli]
MLFDILTFAGLSPSIISGAGLVSLIKKGKIGNAFVGNSEWLVIEADESDGSIVQYHPKIGLLLNIEKDHKELDELMQVFETFKNNSEFFIVNQSNEHSRKLSSHLVNDFEIEGENRGRASLLPVSSKRVLKFLLILKLNISTLMLRAATIWRMRWQP